MLAHLESQLTDRHSVRHPAVRAGVTMVELIVALAVLAVLTGVVGVAMRNAPSEQVLPDWHVNAAVARDSAVRSGRTVTLIVRRDGTPYAVTALPDGRVIADPSLGIDPLSGMMGDAQP